MFRRLIICLSLVVIGYASHARTADAAMLSCAGWSACLTDCPLFEEQACHDMAPPHCPIVAGSQCALNSAECSPSEPYFLECWGEPT